MLTVVLMAAIAFIIVFAVLNLLTTIFKANAHTSLLQEQRQTSTSLINLVHCQNTMQLNPTLNLATCPETDLPTYCTTDVHNILANGLLRLKDQGGNDIGTYNSTSQESQIGRFNFQAGCVYIGTIGSGTVKRCLTIQSGILNPNGTFRKDPLSNRTYLWLPISQLPFCCV